MALRRFNPRPLNVDLPQPVIDWLNTLQTDLSLALDDLTAAAITNIHSIAKVTLGTADSKIFHGLGQPITGWEVIRQDVSGTVYEGSTSADPRRFINLRASAPVTVTLRFT
jgi:hypothetical protein